MRVTLLGWTVLIAFWFGIAITINNAIPAFWWR